MNKKKIFGSIAILVIAAIAAFNVNINTQEKGLSDISLANAEALASEVSYVVCENLYIHVCWNNSTLYGKYVTSW